MIIIVFNFAFNMYSMIKVSVSYSERVSRTGSNVEIIGSSKKLLITAALIISHLIGDVPRRIR